MPARCGPALYACFTGSGRGEIGGLTRCGLWLFVSEGAPAGVMTAVIHEPDQSRGLTA